MPLSFSLVNMEINLKCHYIVLPEDGLGNPIQVTGKAASFIPRKLEFGA